MTVINNFIRLSGNDKKLILNTLLVMVKFRLMLWIMPFSRIQKSLSAVNPIKSNIPVSKLVWAVKMTSHHIPCSTCLTNALTGYSVLSKHGYPSMIKIGVGKSFEGEFEAHAWLEYAGEVVIGESEKEYIPILDLKQ